MGGVVAICGAGNLGRRYLQGILNCESAYDLYVYDVSRVSLDACEQAVRQFYRSDFGGSTTAVSFHDTVDALPRELDLAIVATSADVRPEVVESISSHARVSHFILEKVLAQDESGLERLSRMTSTSKAWVNLPRRMMSWHRCLGASVQDNGPISMLVSGGAWGLACNAVHFIDLLTWWSDETPLSVDVTGLEPNWSPAKREGFWEVHGSMSVTYDSGSCLTLESGHGSESITIQLVVGEMTWLIDEAAGMARRSDGLSEPGVLEFQSEMTPRLVKSILTSGTCELPTLEDSIRTHQVLIRSLVEHWVRQGGQRNGVPIT